MKPASDVTALVLDNSLFIGLAERLSRKYKRVLYFSPWQEAFPTVNRAVIGDGFEQFERVRDIWTVLPEVDLVVVPDVNYGPLQLYLEGQGMPVWGSRMGEELELSRPKFLRMLAEVGLEVPEHTIVKGMTELRALLKDKEDCYLKISRYRGSMETTHWRNWHLDAGLLDTISVKLGPAAELLSFIVCDAIETDIELGGDTFSVDGQWPSLMLHGSEAKDKSYLGVVTESEKMPEQLRDITAAFTPFLKQQRYRNQWSAEVRISEDKAFFIDPCCRASAPASASQWELWANLPEIIWAGAHGELVEPEPTAKYSAEVALKLKSEKHAWGVCDVPADLWKWVKPAGCCLIDGRLAFPPDESTGDEVGWLCSTGNTPEETIENLKEHAAALPDGLTASVETLADALKEIASEEEQGIEFGKQTVPPPETVLQDA